MPNNNGSQQPTDQQPKPGHPQPVFQIRIIAMSNGSTNVNGFLSNLQLSQKIMNAAGEAIALRFIDETKAGNLNKHNNIIPPITVCTGMHVVSPVTPIKHIHEIVTPAKSSLVGAGGKVL
jgi:hypothetical protein